MDGSDGTRSIWFPFPLIFWISDRRLVEEGPMGPVSNAAHLAGLKIHASLAAQIFPDGVGSWWTKDANKNGWKCRS